MSTGLEFDEERARQIEAISVTPDRVAQPRTILTALKLRPGERVLDIGSGPGLLAAEMATAVSPAGHVWRLDRSERMTAMARARCAALPGAAAVEFQLGEATNLPFPDEHVDGAVSTQVYEYVSAIPAALTELYRVLRPGERALILNTDWDSIVWPATDQARSQRVLTAWNEHLADPHLPCSLSAQLRRAGFALHHREVIPRFNPE